KTVIYSIHVSPGVAVKRIHLFLRAMVIKALPHVEYPTTLCSSNIKNAFSILTYSLMLLHESTTSILTPARSASSSQSPVSLFLAVVMTYNLLLEWCRL